MNIFLGLYHFFCLINDPLRPRLLNASCVQVTPQRLAGRFEPHANDNICLTARVNRAQDAAAAKVQSELPTDSSVRTTPCNFRYLAQSQVTWSK